MRRPIPIRLLLAPSALPPTLDAGAAFEHQDRERRGLGPYPRTAPREDAARLREARSAYVRAMRGVIPAEGERAPAPPRPAPAYAALLSPDERRQLERYRGPGLAKTRAPSAERAKGAA